MPALYGNGFFPLLYSIARLAPPHVALQINSVSGRAPQAEHGRLRTPQQSPGLGSGKSAGPTSPPQRQPPGPRASGRWAPGPTALRASGEKARRLPGSSRRPCPLRNRLRCYKSLLLTPGYAMRRSSVGGSPAARAAPRTLPPAPLPPPPPPRPLLHPLAPQSSPGLPKGLPCRSPARPF